MKRPKLKGISPIFTALLFALGGLNLNAQPKIKVLKKEQDVYYIQGICNKLESIYDTLYLSNSKQYQIKCFNKNQLYYLWKGKTAHSNSYFLNKRTLKNNCQFIYHKGHWCNQSFFNKALKQGKYIRLRKKGIILLFKDGSKLKISYQQLDQTLLQDILTIESID